MGLRFRRRLRILSGLWLNVSKSGVSTSIGGHGATLNLSKRGKMTTLGLPGSGLSYRSSRRPWGSRGAGRGNGAMMAVAVAVLAIVAAAILSAS
jgi:Protein of unknown function (DUF4236)